ncbi:MAG: hypothetical protein WC650_03280 [Candidatus Doudnabacteria bacterium]
MADTKTHLVGTAFVILAHWFNNLATTLSFGWHYAWVVIITCWSGILVDVDHFFHWKRVKIALQIRKQDKIPFGKAWVRSFEVLDDKKANLFHTWPMAALIILGAWFLTHSFLPIIAYCFHILIDAFDAGYASKRNFWEIPGCLVQLVPERARYRD